VCVWVCVCVCVCVYVCREVFLQNSNLLVALSAFSVL
jgi:hypothetical protein